MEQHTDLYYARVAYEAFLLAANRVVTEDVVDDVVDHDDDPLVDVAVTLPGFDDLTMDEQTLWAVAADAVLAAKPSALDNVYPTPAHEQAWQQYYDNEFVQLAQQKFTRRERELQPLREIYNSEMTRARLAHQQEVHKPMLWLTMQLRQLDTRLTSPADSDTSASTLS